MSCESAISQALLLTHVSHKKISAYLFYKQRGCSGSPQVLDEMKLRVQKALFGKSDHQLITQ